VWRKFDVPVYVPNGGPRVSSPGGFASITRPPSSSLKQAEEASAMASKRKRSSRVEEAKRVVSTLGQEERQELLEWMKFQPWAGHDPKILIERIQEIFFDTLIRGGFHENSNWQRDDEIIRLKDYGKESFRTIASLVGIDDLRATKQAYHRRKAHLAWITDYLERLTEHLWDVVIRSDVEM
jgi:hypothetical protein